MKPNDEDANETRNKTSIKSIMIINISLTNKCDN